MKKEQLKQLIKEEIRKVLNEDLDIASELNIFYKNSPFNEKNYRSHDYNGLKYIQDKIGRDLTPQEKGKITRISNKYLEEYWGKKFNDESEAEEKAAQERYQNNLLPLTTDNGSGTPDSKYYELANTYSQTLKGGGTRITHSDPKSGYTNYKLKDEWIDIPVDNSTLNQFWKDNTMNYFRIERK